MSASQFRSAYKSPAVLATAAVVGVSSFIYVRTILKPAKRPNPTTLTTSEHVKAKRTIKEAGCEIEKMKNEVRGWGDLFREDVEKTRGAVRAQHTTFREEMMEKSEMLKEIEGLKKRVEGLEEAKEK